MKKLFLTLLALGLMATFAQAEMKCAAGKCGGGTAEAQPKKMMKLFQSVSQSEATLLQEGETKTFCPNCGMTLTKFYKTNFAAKVEGKVKQYCSMHCLVEDIQKGLKPTQIKVVDVASLKFVDAATAFYVVGSKKPGTMSRVSKYAFANKTDAEAFSAQNGGEIMEYESALKREQEDFASDVEMIAKKKAMMTQSK